MSSKNNWRSKPLKKKQQQQTALDSTLLMAYKYRLWLRTWNAIDHSYIWGHVGFETMKLFINIFLFVWFHELFSYVLNAFKSWVAYFTKENRWKSRFQSILHLSCIWCVWGIDKTHWRGNVGKTHERDAMWEQK